MSTTANRKRDKRLELRTTVEERELFERGAEAEGGTLTDFAIAHLTVAAQRALADRDHFELNEQAWATWEEMNARPSRDLPSIRALFARRSPFEE